MNIYLYRNGQSLGPYSLYHIKSWLAAGQIQPTELACYEGTTTWAPLNTLPNIDGHLHYAQPQSGGGSGLGWTICIVGFVLTIFGILLSVTVIGAIIGIPLCVIGIPMIFVGRHMVYKAVRQKMYESAREGALQGMYSYQQTAVHVPYQPPVISAAACSTCGETLVAGADFCGKCGMTVAP